MKQNIIQIKIEYFGLYIDLAGKTSEMIEISSDLKQAYPEIVDYLKTNYGISSPYILLLGQKHIQGAIKQRANVPLQPEEVFKIIPFLSGG